LNSILGFSEVLETSTGLNDKQTRWVHNIHSSGTQLLALINDILDLAKIEAGKMQVRLVEFSNYDVCEGMLTCFGRWQRRRTSTESGAGAGHPAAAPGRGEVPADSVEPDVQRDQVHAGGRPA